MSNGIWDLDNIHERDNLKTFELTKILVVEITNKFFIIIIQKISYTQITNVFSIWLDNTNVMTTEIILETTQNQLKKQLVHKSHGENISNLLTIKPLDDQVSWQNGSD